ncbi:hypothetical protein HPMBJEAJ_00366 [Aeromonas phage avDM6]|nr:hypothetical protein HPMBJEAJ_00366 [Aeromonas phage avDM6]
MWLFKMFNFMVKLAVKHVIPFFFYFGFWALNVYNCVMIPGLADEAVYRFYAAVFFPVGIVWGMKDAFVMYFM